LATSHLTLVNGAFLPRSTKIEVASLQGLKGETGPPGESGVTDHAQLTSLNYAASGHTGFAGTGIHNTFTTGQSVQSSSPFSVVLILRGSDQQSANVVDVRDGSNNILMSITSNGSIKPAHMNNDAAQNDTIYYSKDNGKLCYKDSSGTVNELY
jgi:hypothetical protein